MTENKFINETGAADVSPYEIRRSDAPWFLKAKDSYALVLGAGGIGSNLIFLLSSAGINMSIWDNDLIGAENINAQHFTVSQINQSKVSAIESTCRAFLGNDNSIDYNHARYDKDSPSNPITFMGFDNMHSRKLAYDKWVELLEGSSEEDKSEFILLDGRLLAESYQIYCLNKDNYKDYQQYLFEDSEVQDEPCTFKATRFASWGITSDMTAIFLNWCTNRVYKDDIRDVPFRVEKSYASFYYKTE